MRNRRCVYRAFVVCVSGGLLLAAPEAAAQIEPRVQLEQQQIEAEPRIPEVRLHTWRDAWRHAWAGTNELYEIRPASTVQGTAQCPDDLEIDRIVEETIEAVDAGRHGDAARHLGAFQDRLYCPTRTGVRGVEFALAAFLHLALEELPARERRTAVHGAFNLGLLAFDQMLYTGGSWWLAAMHRHGAEIRRQLRSYPGGELGLWIHHLPSASLVAFSFDERAVTRDALTGPLLAAFRDPQRFGDGECTLLGLVRTGFRCDGSDPLGRGGVPGGGGGGGGAPVGGAAGDGVTACALAAALASGHGGAMRCAVAAGGGGGIRLADHGLSGPIVRGVLDEQCALRSGGEDDYAARRRSFEEGFRDWEAHFQEQMAWLREDFARADLMRRERERVEAEWARTDAEMRDQTREGVVQHQIAQLQAELARLREETEAQRERLEELEKAQGGGAGEMRPEGDGACADGTNAAQRVGSMYGCLAGATAGLPAGLADPREPVVRPAPDAVGGAMPSGLLACQLQGGGLVRGGLEDGRCQVSSCPRGSDTCSCDTPPGRSAPPLADWMSARELLFFEFGGGVTDPPRQMRRPLEIQRRPLDIRRDDGSEP